MKYLALAVVLCALLSLSNARCYPKLRNLDDTHCRDDDDGTWHEVGSSWRNSKCMDCTCDGCCSAYSTPTQIPEHCVSVLDLQACEYKMYWRDNPTVPCLIQAAIGK